MSEAPGECDPSLEGVVLARVHDLADRGTLSIQTDGGLPVLLIRGKGMIRAVWFRNQVILDHCSDSNQ